MLGAMDIRGWTTQSPALRELVSQQSDFAGSRSTLASVYRMSARASLWGPVGGAGETMESPQGQGEFISDILGRVR